MRTRDTDTTGNTTGRTASRSGTRTRATRHADRPDPARTHAPAQDPAQVPAQDQARAQNQTHARAQDLTSADAPAAAPAQPLLALQATAGNAAVVRMLQRRTADGAAQQEAGVDEEGRTAPAPRSTVHDVLRRAGRPLDAAVRADMEARLGADFSDVRIHDDHAARASAAEVGARAYTSGTHVVLGTGGTDPHTLAHELTHVVQQRQGPVDGTDNGAGLRVSDPSDRFEREAEATATRALAAPPPQYGSAYHPGRAHGDAAGTAVQRVSGLRSGDNQRSAPAAAPAGLDRDEILAQLQRYGEAFNRWIQDYTYIFDDIRANVPPFRSGEEDLQAAADELRIQYAARKQQALESTPLTRIFRYLLQGGTRPPGLGGFGDMRVTGTQLDGRPNFAGATQQALSVGAGQHRRHITAWHNIRAFLNRAYAEYGADLTGYLGRRLGHGQVHPGMRSEASESFGRMPAAQLGDMDRNHAEVLLHAAYVMNSSARNLWVGGGYENSEINAVSQALQRGLQEVTPATLTVWRDRLAASAARSAKATAAVQGAVGKIDAAVARIQADPASEQAEFHELRSDIVDEEIRSLEVDLPDAANQHMATGNALDVAKTTFDLLFQDAPMPSLQQVTRVIDFLWTS